MKTRPDESEYSLRDVVRQMRHRKETIMKSMKKGLLVTSFGTAHADTRKKSICLLEKRIQSAYPDRKSYVCYTSPTVRRLMEKREGIHADGPAEAFERIAAEGMEDILIFTTHVIPGIESERLARQAEEFQAAHPEIRVQLTKPLLFEEADYEACAEILLEEYGKYLIQGKSETPGTEKTNRYIPEMKISVTEVSDRQADAADKICGKTALILLGHGTQHAGDACYERLEQVMRRTWREMSVRNTGCADEDKKESRDGHIPEKADSRQTNEQKKIYVITVEGSRTVADIIPELNAEGIRRALMVPFLLTAGEHVMHDMAGDEPNSVKSRLLAAGIDAVPVEKGLGEYEKIRDYYDTRVQKP